MTQSNETQLALLQKDVSYIKDKVNAVEKKMDDQYVSKVEFEPIKRLVYGMVGLVLTSVFAAIIALVVRST